MFVLSISSRGSSIEKTCINNRRLFDGPPRNYGKPTRDCSRSTEWEKAYCFQCFETPHKLIKSAPLNVQMVSATTNDNRTQPLGCDKLRSDSVEPDSIRATRSPAVSRLSGRLQFHSNIPRRKSVAHGLYGNDFRSTVCVVTTSPSSALRNATP